MRKISGYIISLLLILCGGQVYSQKSPSDTIIVPLKVMAGFEISSPVMYFIDNNNLSLEGYVSCDLNEKMAIYLGGGYSDYKYSQYNYDYLSKGVFVKSGVDFNILKPETAMGKYRFDIGIHYGLSVFSSETPTFSYENYWGTFTSSLPSNKYWGHYLEISPGFRAEIFKNFSIGWSVSLRKLIYTGAGKDLRPLYLPGYGSGGKPVSAGVGYFLVWNFSYKKIKVVKKPEPVEEPEETEETNASGRDQSSPAGGG
jgi:hypothetical protein